MRIVFFDFVVHYGGSMQAAVDLGARLTEHAQVTFVDGNATCESFHQAVRDRGMDLRILGTPTERGFIGGRGLGRAIRMAAGSVRLLKTRARLKALLKEFGPYVVNCNHVKSGFLAGTLPGVPLVVQLHGWYTPDMLNPLSRWLLRHRCQAAIAVSRATKSALICSGVEHSRIRVLHNAVDVEEMAALARRPFQEPPPGLDRPVRILVPANLIRSKGQHTAVQALRAVVDAGHDAVLWLAGPHSWAIGSNRDYPRQLEAMARERGLAERVFQLGPRRDVPQLMAAATVVALPSHTEGHPRVVLEAMALGRPMVATPVGGIQDMIAPNLTGLFHDVDDAAGLAACINQLAADPVDARRIGQTGRQYVLANFRPDQITRRAMAIFREAFEAGAPRGRTCPHG